MELRNRTTGAVITDRQFRDEHPNTSFPEQITAEIIDSFGYDPVLEGAQATTTPPYEISVRAGVEEINGQWFTKYIVGPVFTDTEEATAAEQEVEYRSAKDAEQAKAIRQERNKRLAECDWTQLGDSPLDLDGKGAWQLYRETLRMVPQQAGFPWNVQWPPEPTT